MSSVGTVYDRPFWLNHGKCAVTDRAYSGYVNQEGDVEQGQSACIIESPALQNYPGNLPDDRG